MAKTDCNCHDRLNITLGHYLGVTLLLAVLSSLYLGVSGQARDTALLPTLQTMGSVITLIVGGMLAVWSPKQKEAPAVQDVNVTNPPGEPVPVEVEKK